MNKIGRIATACAAVAVAAGIGLTAVPAQAAPNPDVWGQTNVIVSTYSLDTLAAAGIALRPTRHSVLLPITGGALLSLPVTLRPATDGLLAHGGGLKFTFPGSMTKAPITLMRPWLESCTSPDNTCPTLVSLAINGTRINLFVVDVTSSSSHRGPNGIGEAFKGTLRVTNNASLVKKINLALGATIFKPGLLFGQVLSHWGIYAK
jgi:hypothetical protein